ncbi:MAG: hypothetical protein R2849_06260 [Thermomicrobiales bacterium]
MEAVAIDARFERNIHSGDAHGPVWALSISERPPPEPFAVATTLGRPGTVSTISTSGRHRGPSRR